MRDFTTKINDTAPNAWGQLDAQEFNSLAAELEAAVSSSGIALDSAFGPDTNSEMFAQSMTRHVGAALACTDSGSANTYVLTMIGNYVPPTALISELRLRFRPGNANSGESTLNAFGLGSKPLVDHALSPMSGGELEAGRETEAIYRSDVGSGTWVMPSWANALYVDPDPTDPTEIGDGEGWAVNTGSNTGNLNFPGLTNSAMFAATDIFARHVDSVGHRGITGAQLLAAVAGGIGGTGLLALQFITASGTYTKTEGATKALVLATGGGGGGGGGFQNGGGGGAGTAISFIDISEVETVACTIGAGGAGGAAGGNGATGGSTSFGAYAVASGGLGGTRPTATNVNGGYGGYGGIGTVGDVLMAGDPGDNTVYGGATSATGGNGGGSIWGGGGRGGPQAWLAGLVAPVQNGRSPGGGGGGGDGTAAQPNGGAGASGCILVLEFA